MRSTTDTLLDRGVNIHHRLRSTESWFGLIIKVPNVKKIEETKSGLDEILTKEGYNPSVKESDYLYCKGTYTPEVLENLKQYITHNGTGLIEAKGKYEDFVGSRWLNRLNERYRFH